MRHRSPFLALIALTSALAAGEVRPLSCSVKGIAPGSTYSEVVRALGRPDKTAHHASHGMPGMGEGVTLTYRGLVVEMSQRDEIPEPSVWQITVLTSRWRVEPGLRVGAPENTVAALLGEPEDCLDRNPGEKELIYHASPYPRDTWLNVTLFQGRVETIRIEADWA